MLNLKVLPDPFWDTLVTFFIAALVYQATQKSIWMKSGRLIFYSTFSTSIRIVSNSGFGLPPSVFLCVLWCSFLLCNRKFSLPGSICVLFLAIVFYLYSFFAM